MGPRDVWRALPESTVHSSGPSLELERLPTTEPSPTSFMLCSRRRLDRRHNFLLLNLQTSWWIGQQKVRQNCQKIWRLVISKGLSNKWSQAPVILGVRILIALGRETERKPKNIRTQVR